MKSAARICFLLIAVQVFLLNGCTTGVESSPSPGIIRVTLKSNDLDTLLVILGDTIRFSRVDHYDVTVGQGWLYRGVNYAILHTNTSIDRIDESYVNLIQRAWLDGRLIFPWDSVFDVDAFKSRYVGATVFEWYVPPGTYDKLQFNLRGIEVFVARPRQFRNPLLLPEGTTPIMNFQQTIEIAEGRVTQVDLEINPFESIRRYKDAYIFDRKVKIVRIQIL